MKDKGLNKETDNNLKKYLNLLSLDTFDKLIQESKTNYETIETNIIQMIEKYKLQKKDFDLKEKSLTKTDTLINQFMNFDILEIEDFTFIKNYINNESYYEAKEINKYFNDLDIVKIHVLNHAKKNNLKIVIYTKKTDLQTYKNFDTVRNSLDKKIKELEEFGIYK